MRESNVVILKPAQPSVNKSAIEILEDALASAKSGEIASVAIASVLNDGSGRNHISTSENRIALLGSVMLLTSMIQKSFD